MPILGYDKHISDIGRFLYIGCGCQRGNKLGPSINLSKMKSPKLWNMLLQIIIEVADRIKVVNEPFLDMEITLAILVRTMSSQW